MSQQRDGILERFCTSTDDSDTVTGGGLPLRRTTLLMAKFRHSLIR